MKAESFKKYLKNPKSFCYLLKRAFLNKNKCNTTIIKYFSINKQSFLDCENDATVIVPVYNGYEHLKRLLPSLIKNTSNKTKIIFINDCSTDNRVSDLLKNLKINHSVINNCVNLGFVKSINKGMRLVKTKYAIWLNTDTLVPRNWVNKLLDPIVRFKKIASSTPFTNAGTLFSFPNIGENCRIISNIDEINNALEHIKNTESIINESSTGVGFCMGINMLAWREIGELDEIKFGKGYGEENDWCYRAIEHEWKNVISPNLFVEHYHGGSFNSYEKQKLISDHMKILERDHPKCALYLTPKMFSNNSWLVYRQIALLYLSNLYGYSLIYKNNILIFDERLDYSHKNSICNLKKKEFNKIQNYFSKSKLILFSDK